MKPNAVNTMIQPKRRRRGVVLLVFLTLAAFGITSSLAQMSSQKRVTSLQLGEHAEGSRVSVFSDTALNDYEAFRHGDRFYVRLPLTHFAAAQPNFRGKGFEDVQVDRLGDTIIISFKLSPGANARVDQRSNRLDVIFSTGKGISNNYSGNSRSSRSTANAIPGIVTLQTPHIRQRNPDAAGPMPPDSPTAKRPRVVTKEFSTLRRAPERTPQRSHVDATSDQESMTKSANRDTTKPAAPGSDSTTVNNSWTRPTESNSPSTITPSVTPNYPATTTITPMVPLSSRPVATPKSLTPQPAWRKRGELALQWVSANRVTASIGAFVLLSLIAGSCLILFRRRRNNAKTQRAKLPGVQPTYSPDLDSEGLRDHSGNESYDTLCADRDPVAVRPEQELTSPTPATNVSRSGNGSRQRSAGAVGSLAPSTAAAVPPNEVVVTAVPIPKLVMKSEELEREVFEL